MAGELPQEFDKARDEAAFNASIKAMHEFNLSRSGLAESAGLIGKSVGQDGLNDEKRRDDKKKNEFHAALDQARRITELQETIEEANAAINAGNEVLGLMRSGKLDRNNEDHIELMVLAGLDPYDENLTEDDVIKKIEENEQIKQDAGQKLDKLQSSPSVQTQASRDERQELFVAATEAESENTQLVENSIDDLLSEIDVSFASEIDATPIKTDISLSHEFSSAVSGADSEQHPATDVSTENTFRLDNSI